MKILHSSTCIISTTKYGRKPTKYILLQIQQALLIFLLTLIQNSSSTFIENPPGLPTEVVYGWRNIDFNFKCPVHRQQMIDEKKYIIDNVGIAGVKISGDRMFIGIGRFVPGVPATLTEIPYNASKVSDFVDEGDGNGPLLTPFPNWEMQEVGNCEAFQMIQSMEIDQYDRLWVMDIGKSDIFGKVRADCPAKLMVYDLRNHEDKLIRKYEFPPHIMPLANGVAIEIALGCLSEGDCKAYIADLFNTNLIIYSFKDDTSWVVTHRPSMLPEEGSEKYTLLGKPYKNQLGIDGLAVSPRKQNFDTLYYAPLAGYNTYSVSTATLDWAREEQEKNHQPKETIFQLPDSSVTVLNRRTSLTDGMAMDSTGRLFWGANEINSIYSFQTVPPSNNGAEPNTPSENPIIEEEKLVAKNDKDLIWTDSLAFDQQGHLLVITNSFHLAPFEYDRTKINFKIARIFVGAQGGHYYEA